jgi:hypothetical protein
MSEGYTNPTLDWHHWLNMANVALWEAVALSLKIDPKSVSARWYEHKHLLYWSGPGGPVRIEDRYTNSEQKAALKEFAQRLERAVSFLRDEAAFPFVELAYDMRFSRVKLAEFAKWLVASKSAPIACEIRLLYVADNSFGGAPEPAPLAWVEAARRYGEEEHRKHPKRNVEQIAQEVARRLEVDGFRGRGQRIIDWQTVKRHALKGIKS